MTFTGKKHLILDPESIKKHIWMVGGTGSGKSTYARNVIHALRSNDYPNPALIYVDPKGLDAYVLMRELDNLDDVVYLDPTEGFALNPLELPPSPPSQREQIVSLHVGHFEELLGAWSGRADLKSYAPRMTWIFEHVLRYLYSELDAPTMRDVYAVVDAYRTNNRTVIDALEKRFSFVLGDEGQELANALRSFEDLKSDAWMPLMTRISRFTTDPFLKRIFCSRHSTVDLTERLEPGRLTVVRCAGLSGRVLGFFLAGIVLGLWFRAKYRMEIKGKENLALVLGDELNIISNAVQSLEEILSKSRAFGLGIFCLNQNIMQLPRNVRESLMANSATQLVAKSSGRDADFFLTNWGVSSYKDEYKTAMVKSEYWRPYTGVVKDVDNELYELDLPEPHAEQRGRNEVDEFIGSQDILNGEPAKPFTIQLTEKIFDYADFLNVPLPSATEWKILSNSQQGRSFYSVCKKAPLPRNGKIKDTWDSLRKRGDLVIARGGTETTYCQPAKAWFDNCFNPDFSSVAKSEQGQEICERALKTHLDRGDFCAIAKQEVGKSAPDLFAWNYVENCAISIEVESKSEIIHHGEQVCMNVKEFRDSNFDKLEVWFPATEKRRMQKLVSEGDNIELRGVDLNAVRD